VLQFCRIFGCHDESEVAVEGKVSKWHRFKCFKRCAKNISATTQFGWAMPTLIDRWAGCLGTPV
jgi:hypothetical protein